MWCIECGYGSEVCRFQTAGSGGMVKEHATRCPRCGVVTIHLTKCPFKPGTRTLHGSKDSVTKRQKAPKKRTEEQQIEQEIEMVADVL